MKKYFDCSISVLKWGLFFCLKWLSWLVSTVYTFFNGPGDPFRTVVQLVSIFLGTSVPTILFLFDCPLAVCLGAYLVIGILMDWANRNGTDYEFERLFESDGILGEADKEVLAAFSCFLFWPWKNVQNSPELGLSDATIFLLIIFSLVGVLGILVIFGCLLVGEWFHVTFLSSLYLLAGIIQEACVKSDFEHISKGFNFSEA